MTTITVQYDARNVSIKKLLEVIVSLGAKVQKTTKKAEKKVEKTGYDATLQAIKEVKEGEVVRYKNFNEFKERMYAL